MKKVYKYSTGEEIPEGAVYCSTQVEKTVVSQRIKGGFKDQEFNRLVWHYFLVEVKE